MHPNIGDIDSLMPVVCFVCFSLERHYKDLGAVHQFLTSRGGTWKKSIWKSSGVTSICFPSSKVCVACEGYPGSAFWTSWDLTQQEAAEA